MQEKNKYNVITYDINRNKIIPYDILPYLERQYIKLKPKNRPKTLEEFKEFVVNESRYMFWSRCEWEIIISGWPADNCKEKWDVYQQIMMNIDIVVELFMRNVIKRKKNAPTE